MKKDINLSNIKSFILIAMRSVTLVIKFILTLFITHFLGLEELGFFGLVAAAGIMAPSILGLGIMYNISRGAVTQDKSEVISEIRLYLGFLSLLYSIILIFSLLYGLITGNIFLSLISSAIIFFEHLSGDLYSLFLNLSRPFFANFLHFVRSALWAIIYMITAYFIPEFRNIDVLLVFWLIGGILSSVSYFIPLGFSDVLLSNGLGFKQCIDKIIKRVKTSYVVYANACFISLSHYIDRYIITFFLGLELAGVYIFFWQIYSALSNLLYTGVIQIYRPLLVRSYREKMDNFFGIFRTCLKKSTVISSVFAFISVLVLYFCIPYLNKPLMEDNFILVYFIFTGFIISIILETMNLIFYSRHQDLLSLKIKIISFFIIVIMNLIFLQLYGLLGAGISFTISLTIQLLIQHIYLSKHKLYRVY